MRVSRSDRPATSFSLSLPSLPTAAPPSRRHLPRRARRPSVVAWAAERDGAGFARPAAFRERQLHSIRKQGQAPPSTPPTRSDRRMAFGAHVGVRRRRPPARLARLDIAEEWLRDKAAHGSLRARSHGRGGQPLSSTNPAAAKAPPLLMSALRETAARGSILAPLNIRRDAGGGSFTSRACQGWSAPKG